MMNKITKYEDSISLMDIKFCDMVMENNVSVAMPNVSTRTLAMFPESVESLNPLDAEIFLPFLDPLNRASNENISESEMTVAIMHINNNTQFLNVTWACKAEMRTSVFTTNLIFGVIMPLVYIVMSIILPLCKKKLVTGKLLFIYM